MIYAKKPGDGSAREQAASCQRVIGGLANITKEYATKRYRSNVMNWGMLPFQMKAEPEFEVGDYIYVPDVKAALDGDMQDIKAYVIGDEIKEISLYIAPMTDIEKEIVKESNPNHNTKAYFKERLKNAEIELDKSKHTIMILTTIIGEMSLELARMANSNNMTNEGRQALYQDLHNKLQHKLSFTLGSK